MSCSALSLAAGIPLAGTATRAERWLLLEHRAPWGRDAVDGSGLPRDVVDHLAAFEGRVLLIRSPGRRRGATVVFHAVTTEDGGMLRRTELERLEDVVEVDPEVDGAAVDGPLVLVCTHARRDPCCGVHGVRAYNALAPHLPDGSLWRSSHQGGHRFAANVFALPAGIQLGRVEPAAAAAVAASLEEARVPLDSYRGRSLHAPAVQAADAAVRRELGADRLADVRLLSHEGGLVRLDTPHGVVGVRVEERIGPALPASCGKEAEETVLLEATLLGPARGGR